MTASQVFAETTGVSLAAVSRDSRVSRGLQHTADRLLTHVGCLTGTAKNLDMLEASLTYNPDQKTNYFGLTTNYRKGINEITAQRVQTWTVGLSAKY